MTTLQLAMDRARANAVPCRHCGAPAGQTCHRSDGADLEHFPAHLDRLADSNPTGGWA